MTSVMILFQLVAFANQAIPILLEFVAKIQ